MLRGLAVILNLFKKFLTQYSNNLKKPFYEVRNNNATNSSINNKEVPLQEDDIRIQRVQPQPFYKDSQNADTYKIKFLNVISIVLNGGMGERH